MREILIAGLLFALLAGGAVVVREANLFDLAWAGGFLILAGLAFSTPCAVRYHLLLHRSLKARGALDRNWLLNPTRHHERLTNSERAQVLPWFYAGAAGWGAAMLGCVVLGTAVVLV